MGNTASALTAQSAFLNNFENVVNRRVDIREDIKRYQDTISYVSSKVNYSVGENNYMLPSDMNVKSKTGTVGYNNKILISNGKFCLGKNDKVHGTPKISHQPTITHGAVKVPMGSHFAERPCARMAHEQKPNIQKQTITQLQKPTHEEEKIALILFLTGGFTVWYAFR